jgi:hypothetical protein
MIRQAAIAALVVVGGTAGATAHHSIAGVYDTARTVTVEGLVTRFEFVNPHPFVWVDVRAGTAAQLWRLEMDNRGELADIGISASTLRPGDRVIVSGSPSRGEPQRLYVRRLDRPADGFGYEQIGSRPRLRKGR